MMPHNRGGFALVVSLLVLVVVVALGVGATFLSMMNVRIAENTRAHAMAVSNAETGLELAMIALYEAYESANPKQFPSAFSDQDLPSHPSPDVQFTVGGYDPADSGYDVYQPTLVRVAIRGSGPRGAEFVAEALLGSTIDQVDPIFNFGMISEKSIGIAGASGTFIDAGMHTNDALWLPGFDEAQFVYCDPEAARGEDLKCPDGARNLYGAGGEPLSVWKGGSMACGPGQGPAAFCDGGVVKEDYQVEDELIVPVDFQERRYRAAGGSIEEEEGGTTYSDGAITIDGSINLASPECLDVLNYSCFAVDVTVTPEQIQGKTVISGGTITVDCGGDDCSINNTTLISTNGTVDLSSVSTATNVRVFSELDLDTATGSEWRGQSTLASAGNVTLQGTSKMFSTADGPGVGVSLIAEGDINVTGGGGTVTPAVFVAGGSLNWAGGGGTYIIGAVLVKDGVSIAGGYTIDSGFSIWNPDLGGVRGEAELFSRR